MSLDLTSISGCFIGMALGDALGAETEFLNMSGILQRFPPTGPQAPQGHPARVTDVQYRSERHVLRRRWL